MLPPKLAVTGNDYLLIPIFMIFQSPTHFFEKIQMTLQGSDSTN